MSDTTSPEDDQRTGTPGRRPEDFERVKAVKEVHAWRRWWRARRARNFFAYALVVLASAGAVARGEHNRTVQVKALKSEQDRLQLALRSETSGACKDVDSLRRAIAETVARQVVGIRRSVVLPPKLKSQQSAAAEKLLDQFDQRVDVTGKRPFRYSARDCSRHAIDQRLGLLKKGQVAP